MSGDPELDLQRSMGREMSSAILGERDKNILICGRMKVVLQRRRRTQEMKAAAVTAQLLRIQVFGKNFSPERVNDGEKLQLVWSSI